MKSKYGAVTIGFSGWAQSTKFSFGRRADYSVTMSDHCDFNELVDMVVTIWCRTSFYYPWFC